MKAGWKFLVAAALCCSVAACDDSSGGAGDGMADAGADATGDADAGAGDTDVADSASPDTGGGDTGGGDTALPDASDGAGGDTGPMDTSGGDAGADATDTGADTDAGSSAEPDFDWPDSQFALELAPWGISFRGSVLSGPRPPFHVETAREGACRLLEYDSEPCDPFCEWPEFCLDGECVAQPELVGIGDLSLVGLDTGPLLIEEPNASGYWYDLEDGAVAPGASELLLTSANLEIPVFELSAAPTTAPDLNADWQTQLEEREPGEDVVLSWSDPEPGARIYLRMTTGIGTHGGISPVEIECEGPDTGTLTLPGPYLDALYAQGWSCGECGGNDLWRYHAAVEQHPHGPAPDAPIQFRVTARAQFWHHPNW